MRREMSELKDPKIKLFGKTIELPDSVAAQFLGDAGEDCTKKDSPSCSGDSKVEDRHLNGEADEQESSKSLSGHKQDNSGEDDGSLDDTTAPPNNEDSNAPNSTKSEATSPKPSNPEEEQTEACNSQEKNLKKPEKILPCPRCNSMETKFCYFNNYNVNQPRHFCKNCQRYWTAGGTMRNVPVGAGRRKNKSSISQFHHLIVPEAAQLDLPNGIHHNGTVLTFTTDSPLCESMASSVSIAEKTIRNSSRNWLHSDLGISISRGSKENKDDQLNRSSIGAASSSYELGKTGLPELMPNCHPFPAQVPCSFPRAPWPSPWNSFQWSSPLSPPGFPVPFMSPAQTYWGCTLPGTWSVPMVSPPRTSDQHPHTAPSSTPYSPTLGKHSRDDKLPTTKEEKILKESINSDKCVWTPKTLRIDDLAEASKSSIWAALGAKKDRADSVVVGRGLFKAFQSSKSGGKSCVPETPLALQANPAALSRSLSFRECS